MSVKSAIDKHGDFKPSAYRYDSNFQLLIKGKVGRNGKIGTVKAAKIIGINTSLKGMSEVPKKSLAWARRVQASLNSYHNLRASMRLLGYG